jgi:hypothetical protein
VEELPLTHEIFHAFYDIDRVIQVPNISNGINFTVQAATTDVERNDDTGLAFGISDDTDV